MKKRTRVIIIVIASIVILGTIFGLVDYNRVKDKKKPLFMISLRNHEDPLNYIGLGYRMQRFTSLSHKQELSHDLWVKFGLWFYMKDVKYESTYINKAEDDKLLTVAENKASCDNKDFEMNLYTDKKIYKITDKINIFTTIKYTGNKDEIKIYHPGSYGSDTYFYYSISDGKKFNLDSVTNLMAKITVLKKDELYKEKYVKSGSWDPAAKDAKFWDEFFKEKDLYLPEGKYTMTVKNAFSTKNHGDKETNLTCKLNFKVEK